MEQLLIPDAYSKSRQTRIADYTEQQKLPLEEDVDTACRACNPACPLRCIDCLRESEEWDREMILD